MKEDRVTDLLDAFQPQESNNKWVFHKYTLKSYELSDDT